MRGVIKCILEVSRKMQEERNKLYRFAENPKVLYSLYHKNDR